MAILSRHPTIEGVSSGSRSSSLYLKWNPSSGTPTVYIHCEEYLKGFRIRAGSTLEKVFNRFAECTGLPRETLHFEYGGKELQAVETPETLGCGTAEGFDIEAFMISEPGSSPISGPAPDVEPGKITIIMEFILDKELPTLELKAKPTAKVDRVLKIAAQRSEVPERRLRMIFNGTRAQDHETLSELGVEDGDYIQVMQEQTAGKPVIYLFPPFPMCSTVRLRLVPSWRFDAIYPVAPVCKANCGDEAVEWKVEAQPDGLLTEKSSGLQVSYLFWEAKYLAPIHFEESLLA